MSCFKALSSYWPGQTEKDDHNPFQNMKHIAETIPQHYRHTSLLTVRL
jgi:hypothetical protein